MPKNNSDEYNAKILKFLQYFVSSLITEDLPDSTKELILKVFKYHKKAGEINKYIEKLKLIEK